MRPKDFKREHRVGTMDVETGELLPDGVGLDGVAQADRSALKEHG